MPPRTRLAIWVTAGLVGAFQLIGSYGAASNQPERRPMDVLAVVLVLAGPAALAFRDRWPLAVAAATMAVADAYVGIGYAYGPIFVCAVVAIFSAVRAGHRRPTWILAGAGYVGFAIASVVDPRSGHGSTVLRLTVVAGWLALLLAVSEVVRIRQEQAASVRRAEREERQRALAEQRLGLAQELHDLLAHNISLINVQASVALHLVDEQPERARPALAHIKKASSEALQELRAALDLLRHGDDAPRAPAPRLSELDDLVAGVRAGGLDISLERHGSPTDLPASVELAAYRIVQESLTNVTRHARAGHVTVRVGYDDGVDIEVTDDGIGLAAAAVGTDGGSTPNGSGPRPGNGITGMRERATAVGGTLEAGPASSGGFRVSAHLPERQP